MDKEMSDKWDATVEELMELGADRRTHFAMLIMRLAECYKKDNASKAVILIDTGDSLLSFSAGATEYECAAILQAANEVVNDFVTADAPAKEMFN